MFRKMKVFLIAFGIMTNIGVHNVNAAEKKQVILISFDGMRNDLTKKFVKEGKLPHIKKLMKQGTSATRSRTITPSLTAPSHAAIATGARPRETGFVSNQWHEEGTKLTNKNNAFKQELDVSPIWKEARKSGKTTATIIFPGANPKTGEQADYTIFYGDTWAQSKLEELNFIPAQGWEFEETSYSEPQEAKFNIDLEKMDETSYHMLAIDSTDDHRLNYDSFVLSTDKVVDETDAKISGNMWGSMPVKVKDGEYAGYYFKLKSSGESLSQIKMYRTAVTSGSIQGPRGFSEDIHKKFGFFPVQDDTKALVNGWITRKEYEEVSTRFTDWVSDVSIYIKQEYKPDLLMYYAPQIDHEQHEFLLEDPRQPGYTEKKAEENNEYIEWSYKVADSMVGQMMRKLKANDQLFVVSDHGMEPAHTTIEPNKILLDEGYLKLTDDGKVDVKESKAYAVASGSSANIYVNLEDREKGGQLKEKEYIKTKSELIKLFKDYEVPVSKEKETVEFYVDELFDRFSNDKLTGDFISKAVGELNTYAIKDEVKPFEKIIETSKNRMAKHENFGDLLILTGEGFIVGQGHKKVTHPAEELGTHGGDPNREALRPVFFAMGSGIKKGNLIHSVTNLDVAPTLYHCLAIKAPKFVEGQNLKGIFQK
ncbi:MULTISPECIES: nucleotide pyrophosphatase/phosphodiesterase family protein [unclassified Bacillus (in: firmicutes)]|uniref:nucleotide pyrophosphatase/phosphodiesterase family protein n=1 Tax=unclassified Bacillus (in: firmicutes) TaxID=185979 RepID=UPI0008E214A2|nr:MULTISPECIES: nucleotide pyrophosphatase/phosphodiesterase family protein [unclassified Bacillus (in: firmicutes)]SFA72903.1 Type I phosphodiesterase / nucleotide pyrophosphatase [Bacillus sp. UNCCL13]SFQ62999.1 Type I phosphodiesterase / nucleotide pyrophosphatase [Bacillus sp. cl95]